MIDVSQAPLILITGGSRGVGAATAWPSTAGSGASTYWSIMPACWRLSRVRRI